MTYCLIYLDGRNTYFLISLGYRPFLLLVATTADMRRPAYVRWFKPPGEGEWFLSHTAPEGNKGPSRV